MSEIKSIAMRDALIMRIWDEMRTNKRVVFVSADFGSPVLDKIRSDFPEQFVNVGIAEQNLVNVSVGLALEGYTVFLYAIAPFIPMRCYEQIRVNIALLSELRPMNINLIAVGAGVSYAISGPTHQCYEDISLMRALPNFEVLSPADHNTADLFFDYCMSRKTNKYLRFDVKPLPSLYDSELNIDHGYHIHNSGVDLCLIATGYMVHTALDVSAMLEEIGLRATVIDLFNITHFSRDMLLSHIGRCKCVVTIEEGFLSCGGLDSMVMDFLMNSNLLLPIKNIGMKSEYSFLIGSREELHDTFGVSSGKVVDKILGFVESCQEISS